MKRALTSLGGLDVDSSSATYLCHEVGPSLDLLGSHPRSVENPAVVRLLEQGPAPSRCSVNTRWHLPSPPTQTPHPPEPLPHLPHLCPLCPVPRTRRHSRPSLGSPLPSLQKGLAERHSSPLFLGRIHAGRLCPQPLSPSAPQPCTWPGPTTWKSLLLLWQGLFSTCSHTTAVGRAFFCMGAPVLPWPALVTREEVFSAPHPLLFLSSAQVAELHRARRAHHPRLPSAVRTIQP